MSKKSICRPFILCFLVFFLVSSLVDIIDQDSLFPVSIAQLTSTAINTDCGLDKKKKSLITEPICLLFGQGAYRPFVYIFSQCSDSSPIHFLYFLRAPPIV